MNRQIPVKLLGQSGCRFNFPDLIIYFDPYLSNSVQELDSPDLKRLIDIPFAPEAVTDADWVLISHEHIDHCDPYTLPKLAQASPKCRFMGPQVVMDKLADWGIASERLFLALEDWQEIGASVKLRAIPAAHPTINRDTKGNLAAVGYLFEYQRQRIYLAGDTSVTQRVIDTLLGEMPIHTAFIPINEHNFFKERRGIIGNMSLREAFGFAEEIGVQQLVPVHGDMFEINYMSPAEIQAVYDHIHPKFRLLFQPDMIEF